MASDFSASPRRRRRYSTEATSRIYGIMDAVYSYLAVKALASQRGYLRRDYQSPRDIERREAQRQVDEWNRLYPPGTPVRDDT